MADLGNVLKQYLINTLESMGKDVVKQIDKWAEPNVGFISKYCTAHKNALKRQAEVLKEYEEEEQRCLERAFLVVELLSIGATAWLGAALEQKWGPKIFFKYGPQPGGMLMLPKRMLERIPKHFESKIFADAAKDLVSMFIKKLSEPPMPAIPVAPMDDRKVAFSPNFEIFGNNFYVELDAQKRAVSDSINQIMESVNNSVTMAQSLMNRLRKENPRFNSLGPQDQELAGHKMINDLLNDQWNTWAQNCYYLGYDPPTGNWPKVEFELERQLWGIYTMQQGFHAERISMGGLALYALMGYSGPILNDTGGFASLIKTSVITQYLWDKFNAPVLSIITKGMPTSEVGVGEKVTEINEWAKSIVQDPRWLNQYLQGQPRAPKSVDKLWN